MRMSTATELEADAASSIDRYPNADLLNTFAEECGKKLLNTPALEFKYPKNLQRDSWDGSSISELNEALLDSLRNQGNVYALFLRGREPSEWRPMYVGQRHSANLHQRLREHLIEKHYRTGSKLAKVKDAVWNGDRVAVSFIKIEPERLRFFVESVIIDANRSGLPWNIQGK